MPLFRNNLSVHLSTDQVNQSRFITKSRYIIEVLNGRIKKWFKYVFNASMSILLKSVERFSGCLRILIFNALKQWIRTQSENLSVFLNSSNISIKLKILLCYLYLKILRVPYVILYMIQ